MLFETRLDFHGKAYGWQPQIDVQDLFSSTDKRGHLLRSRIREVVEHLDQLYQYGQDSNVVVNSLGVTTYDEDIPTLDALEFD